MRERENKRKANLKKKVEREQKEREARTRMNIPSPVKGFYVGPSQIRLSGFLSTGVKRKREDIERETGKMEEKELEATKCEEEQLETTKRKPTEPETASPEKPSPQRRGLTDPTLLSMASPKSRAPLQPRSANPTILPKPLFFAEPTKSSVTNEDDWDSFLASNTQIERELADPTARPNVAPPPTRPCITLVSDDMDILDLILTQDLDYTDESVSFKSSIPQEESKHDDQLIGKLDFKDEAKKESGIEYEVKAELDYKVEFRAGIEQQSHCKAEFDYGDDIDCEPDRKDENATYLHSNNHSPFPYNEPNDEPTFEKGPLHHNYDIDTSTIKLATQKEDSDFDDGIKDEEFETFIASCETKLPHASEHPNNPTTEPFPAQRHTSAMGSFDYGDFELSTQEMRELDT